MPEIPSSTPAESPAGSPSGGTPSAPAPAGGSAPAAADAPERPAAASPGFRADATVEEIIAARNAALAGGLGERLGMSFSTLSAERATATMPVAGNTQPMGLLHGGASIALAETMASFAAHVHAVSVHGPGAYAVGTDVSATHHRSARDGVVTAVCTARHLGRSSAFYLVEVHDEAGRLLCTATVNNAVIQPRP